MFEKLARQAIDAGDRLGVDDRADLKAALGAAFRAEFPAAAAASAAARAAGRGKKAVVAAAVGEMLTAAGWAALADVASARSWRDAEPGLRAMGVAGLVLGWPERAGLAPLPCAAFACPGNWGTNWGLPNVQAVAARLLGDIPTEGEGWRLVPA